MDDECTITGLEQLDATFHEIGEKLAKKALHDACDYAGSVIQTAVRDRAPIAAVGTMEHPAGQLKADIRRKIFVNIVDGTGEAVIFPAKSSFYGAFAEFGTSHQQAKPWMRPAFIESQDEAVDVFCKVIEAYIQDFANKKGAK